MRNNRCVMRAFVILLTMLPLSAQQRWSLEHQCATSEEPLPTLNLQSVDIAEPHVRTARGRMFDYEGTIRGRTIEEMDQPSDMPPDPAVQVDPMPFPTFPAAQADIVAIGDVSAISAYLSENRRHFYTELGFRTSVCLKGCNKESVIVQDEGARLRLPSGTLVSGRVCGAGGLTLRMGRRYVVALSYDTEARAARVMQRLEVVRGRVPGGLTEQEMVQQIRRALSAAAEQPERSRP